MLNAYRHFASRWMVLALFVALAIAAMFAVESARAQEDGTIKYPENGTDPVVTFSAVDPEGKTVTWSVAAAATDFSEVDGITTDDAADAALFDINKTTGDLTFIKSPDFEMPRDTPISGSNTNTYKVVIAASDGAGADAKTAYHAVTVEVENVDEAATTTIELSSLQPRASVEIEVAYVDGVGNPFVDTTGADNAAIVDPDGTEADTTVTTIPGGEEGDVTWQWSRATTRNGTFTDIPGDTAKTTAYTPDSGDVNRYLRVTATYEDGHGEDKTLTATSAYPVLSSRSTNSAPAFSDDFDTTADGDQSPAAMLDDGSTEGDNVGDPITADDAQNDRLTYSFDTGTPTADADVFQIDRRTGQVTVGLGKTVSPAGDTDEPDSVTKQATFTVTIKATDPSGDSDTVELTITMDETDEAPVFTAGKTSHEYEENTDVATVVYTFAAYDPETNTPVFALSGDDASKFELGSASGELTFAASPNFEAPVDANGDNVYEVTVKASDTSTPAKSTSLDVTVTVTNVDEDGSVALSASQPRIGIEIRANTPTDPDGGVTGVTWQWQRADDAAGPYADIKDATAAGYTPVAADDGKFLRAVASYTDAEGSGKTAQGEPADPNVAVAKVRNLAPAFADEDDDTPGIQVNPRAVPENSAAGTSVTDPEAADPAAAAPVVATDTADADGDDDTSIFYILSGTDAQYFEIADPNSDDGAQINVKSGTELDHETKDTYTVTLTARDPEGLYSSVTVTINVTDVDEGPDITGPDSEMYPENGTDPVATFSAVDPEGKTVTWSVAAAATDFSEVDGITTDDAADAALFDINKTTGDLTFIKSPDFEMPRDTPISGSNTNTYKVVIAASDGAGADAKTAYHAVTVEVENVDEAATTTIELSSLQPRASVEIEVAYVDGVGNPFVDTTGADNAAIVDPDGTEADTTVTTIPGGEEGDVTWQWSRATTRNGTFTDIPGDTAKTTAYTPDSGDVNRYLRVTATYEDGHGEDKTLTATSAYPVLSSRSTNSAPAFSDDFDTTADGDQSPAAMLDDGSTEGDNVGDPITADDAQNDRLTYSFDTGTPTADADVFQIDRRTGQVTVGLGKTVSPAGDTDEPDSVTKQATFTVTIKATDPSGDSDTVELTITMDETDEAPVFTAGKTSHEYEENTDVATVVYTFAAYDPETNTPVFALSGDDASKFELGSASGELTFAASPNFEAPVDANGDNVYEVTVKASDTSTPAKSTSLDVTVTVTNVDEDGSVALSASQPRIGIEIRANTPTDPDGGVTGVTWQWQRADDAAGPYADIKDATAAGYTPVAADDGKFLRAVASYTDAEGSGKTAQGEPADPNVAVAKVRNLAPAFADEDDDTPGIQVNPRAVPENSAAGTSVTDPEAADPAAAAPVVATDTADADGDDDTSIFYILSGTDAQYFEIADPNSDDGAQINVKSGTELDHETKDTYTVTLTARDPEGLYSSVTVTINVTDVDEPPVITGGAGPANKAPTFPAATADRSVDEDAVVPTDVGPAVSATDPDPGDTLAYTLEGTDASSFTIDGASGQLRTAVALNRATKSTYTVVVKATDDGGLHATVMVTITVNAATVTNHAPEFQFPAAQRSIAENTAPGTNIGAPVVATDADNDRLTYRLGGADMADFDIDPATGQLMTKSALDYETKDTYTVVVTATDTSRDDDEVTVTITVTDVDETQPPLLTRYDTDGDGCLQLAEARVAIGDYFGPPRGSKLSLEDAREVVGLHFTCRRASQ